MYKLDVYCFFISLSFLMVFGVSTSAQSISEKLTIEEMEELSIEELTNYNRREKFDLILPRSCGSRI